VIGLSYTRYFYSVLRTAPEGPSTRWSEMNQPLLCLSFVCVLVLVMPISPCIEGVLNGGSLLDCRRINDVLIIQAGKCMRLGESN